jgi:LysM repeat protein
VQKGETLYSIAKSRGLTVDQLRKINRLGKSTNIKVGQVLKFS